MRRHPSGGPAARKDLRVDKPVTVSLCKSGDDIESHRSRVDHQGLCPPRTRLTFRSRYVKGAAVVGQAEEDGITLVAPVIGRPHHPGTSFPERTSPARGPVPHAHLVTFVEQPLGERASHPAESDDRYPHALLPCLPTDPIASPCPG
jgi:hypothetical protein